MRKHARASQVSVLVTKKEEKGGESFYLRIGDNGIGILQHESKRHFGLKTMKERANSVGGSLYIDSETGKGTTIECWLPCLEPGRLKKSQALFPDERKMAASNPG